MTKDIIQFSHANGFPGSCYRCLFSQLENEYDIRYIDTLGHNPAYPVTDNWTHLVQELVDELDRNVHQPVIGMGHSLGGAITLFAAIKRPDLFKAIVLLDSPIFSFAKAKIVHILKRIGRIRWITPGERAEFRRMTFSSYDEAFNYFRSRPLFHTFDQNCLKDFVTYGTVSDGKQLVLKFNPKIEAAIYKTLPHNFSEYKNKLSVPTAAIIGSKSHIVHGADIKSMKKHYNIQVLEVTGGHLFPFEHPNLTANAIRTALYELLSKTKE